MLWELASQDIYDKTHGYILCKFFPCKRFDNKHMLFNTQHTSNPDWQRNDQGAAGLCLSALMTHSAIGQLRQPSAMRQNNQQRTVTSQDPRSQFLRFLSLGKPKGISLQE
jgi:hypothetical protein